MYEEPQVPVLRRFLWLALWLVVIIAVIWVLVWLIFFRPHNTAQPLQRPNQSNGRSQTAKPTQTPKTSNNSPSNQPTRSGQSTQPNVSNTPGVSGSSAATPKTVATANGSSNRLANTGPGNALVPAVITGAVASGLYYARLRRKLTG